MQVTQHPLVVISHLHMAIVMLQLHTIMPFMVQHTLHIPPAIIAQRFCIIVHAAGSSHSQVIFIPPAHFSTFIMHRGTMTMFGAVGIAVAAAAILPIPVIAERSIIIAVVMIQLALWDTIRSCSGIPKSSKCRVGLMLRLRSCKTANTQLLSSNSRLQFEQIDH